MLADSGDITTGMSIRGEYPVHFTFPQPGRYVVVAGRVTEDGPLGPEQSGPLVLLPLPLEV